jgi:hypothetical protein
LNGHKKRKGEMKELVVAMETWQRHVLGSLAIPPKELLL